MDEIVPLMNQTKISATPTIANAESAFNKFNNHLPTDVAGEPLQTNDFVNRGANEVSADAKTAQPMSARKAHKIRKKLKSKSSRRNQNQPSLENGSGDRRGSDSDRK